MALNYSQRPIFPAHTSQGMVNGYVAEMSEKGVDEFVRARHGNGGMRDRFGYGREWVDKGGSSEAVTADIVDLLPSDPFGMDIDIGTTFTALTGWLEDLEEEFEIVSNLVDGNEDYGLFEGINLIWNSGMRFQSFPSNEVHDVKAGASCMGDKYAAGCQFRGVEADSVIDRIHFPEDIMGFDHGSTSDFVGKSEALAVGFKHSSNAVGGDPHEAFVLALSYLGTSDLLLVERVCKSLCSTVHKDPLLWRSIHIDQPLNERITDDILVQLTNRAEGYLQCLTLIKCPRITDNSLRHVLETNPKLTKLSIPGCTRLGIEGILSLLKAFKSSKGFSGIKQIRTGGFYGVTLEHYKELKFLLGTDDSRQQNSYNPHYYHRGNLYLPSLDDRDIDVEICPRCQNVRLVYDCPAESCQVKDQCDDLCRACIICIPRCVQCGRCVHNSEYEETFSLEYLCSGCLKELPGCQNIQEMDVDVDGSTEIVQLHG
uniref:F-box protein SKIP14-like n=1 Tax=Erigeron canadensis TaxID=72917 RepID=UPI001CB9B041|nr:F-box protein SKIP14-like [Erigeron canadensis]